MRSLLVVLFLLASLDARAQSVPDKKAGDDKERCLVFRDEAEKFFDDITRMNIMVEVSEGKDRFMRDVKDAAAYRAALDRTAQLCHRLPDEAAACLRLYPNGSFAKYCGVAAKADELMKQGVKNLIAHHAQNGSANTVEAFAKDGWIDIDGVTTWSDYFTGAKTRKTLAPTVDPMLEQAKISADEAEKLWATLAASQAPLEAKARELAPTWPLEGTSCAGEGCAEAKKFVASQYGGGTIKRFLQSDQGWEMRKDNYRVPLSRKRTGYALVQVKGDPFCQLRAWSLTQNYAGGGRYSSKSELHLHYVRWQTCK
jgi:hypothetical protein